MLDFSCTTILFHFNQFNLQYSSKAVTGMYLCYQQSGNIVDPDQLASEKPADLDLQCFQNRIYMDLAW